MSRWLAILAIALAAPSAAAAEPFRIALIENAADSEARRADLGFRLGLDYATKGALSAAGHALEVTVLDDGGEPALGGRLLDGAFRESRADLAVSLEADPAPELPWVATELKHILLGARGGTGAPNRYIFRTAHTASQLALACVTALGTPELNLFAVAPETPAGRDAVAALKDALERIPRGVFYSGAKFIRPNEPDVAAAVSSEYGDLHYLHGAKTLLMLWSGSGPPIDTIAATNPGRFGIRLALCGDMDPHTGSGQRVPALEGVTPYFYSLRRNAANDWLIAHAHERPDQATAEGMAAAIAVVEALTKASSTGTEALISSLEGLSFETASGPMTIDPRDHQASQAMYQFRIEPPSSRPELVREIAEP